MIKSAIIYLIVILSTYLLGMLADKEIIRRGNNNKFKIYSFLTILIPSIIAGIRVGVGTDYNMYVNSIFKRICNVSSIIQAHKVYEVEIGYSTLNFIISRFTNNEHVMLFIISFLTNLFIFLAIYNYRKYISIKNGMFIYMIFYYQTTFNLMRQSLALAIVLYAITCLLNNKRNKAIFFIIIASMLHYSALFSLTIIPINKLIKSKASSLFKMLIIVLLCSIFVFYRDIMMMILSLLGHFANVERYYRYLDINENISFSLSILLLRIPFILISLFYIKKMYKYNKDNKLLLFLLVLELILAHLSLISDYSQRIALYFGFTKILFLPQITRCIEDNDEKVAFNLMFKFILILYWGYYYIYCNYGGTVPFRLHL